MILHLHKSAWDTLYNLDSSKLLFPNVLALNEILLQLKFVTPRRAHGQAM